MRPDEDPLEYLALALTSTERRDVWREVAAAIEEHTERGPRAAVVPPVDLEALRSAVAAYDFRRPRPPLDTLRWVIEHLRTCQMNSTSTGYFGLFLPAPATMGAVGDALAAGFNSHLSSFLASPFGVELEQHLVRAIGTRLGYADDVAAGMFTSGGSEANHTAVTMALARAFADIGERGMRSLPRQPTVYVSTEGHHSVQKACKVAGLGTAFVREVPTNDRLQLDVSALALRLRDDRRAGLHPLLVVATAGTTSAGVIDPLAAVADVAAAEGLWFHVDGAYGAAAALVEQMRVHFAGIERADSITLDPHKWLSMPAGAGIFLTRHRDVMKRAFHVASPYMPSAPAGLDLTQPYLESLQWSRRFTGLKLFLALAVAGWEGYAQVIGRMTALGHELRVRLAGAGWVVRNDTPLPVVCFDVGGPTPSTRAFLQGIADRVRTDGRCFITVAQLGEHTAVLRANIANFRSTSGDLERLVHVLGECRAAASLELG